MKERAIYLKNFTIYLIKMYQAGISANTYIQCRYFPTCSNYSINALKEYGFIVGIFISVKRLLRCFFFNKMSYDPLPEINQNKLLKFHMFHVEHMNNVNKD
jgi:hypothetical protein